MNTSKSRRAVLVGAGALGIGGFTAASQLRLGEITSWDPAADTWPLHRYDPAGTACNVDADPPADPTIAWTASPLPPGYDHNLVVGSKRVYTAGHGVAALDRRSGTKAWSTNDSIWGGPIALRKDSLYVAPDDTTSRSSTPALRAFNISDGSTQWTTIGDTVRETRTLLVVDGTVYVGTESGLTAVNATTGRKQWTASTFREPVTLVYDGRIHTAGGLVDEGTVGRYDSRTFLDIPRGSSPPLDWTVDNTGVPTALAATKDALVGGFRYGPDSLEEARYPAGLMCFDPEDGSVRWRALGPPQSSGLAGGPLAVSDESILAGIQRDGNAVAAFRLVDGSERWRHQLDGKVVDIAVGGGTVLLATDADCIRALRLADGTELWQRTVFEIQSIALVDGAIFAVTTSGTVAALR